MSETSYNVTRILVQHSNILGGFLTTFKFKEDKWEYSTSMQSIFCTNKDTWNSSLQNLKINVDKAYPAATYPAETEDDVLKHHTAKNSP